MRKAAASLERRAWVHGDGVGRIAGVESGGGTAQPTSVDDAGVGYPCGDVKNCRSWSVRPRQACDCGRVINGIGMMMAGMTERPFTSA